MVGPKGDGRTEIKESVGKKKKERDRWDFPGKGSGIPGVS